MPRVAPAESDILCENCGYMLNGLPDTGNCPECGEPIAASTIDAGRFETPWEIAGGTGTRAFLFTSARAIFRPTQFFRSLITRASVVPAHRFAKQSWSLAAALFAGAAVLHFRWFEYPRSGSGALSKGGEVIAWFVFAVATIILLAWTTKLAAKLTMWEAAYRGYRMPINAVLRGMYYHAAHYVPVAAIALLTVLTFDVLFRYKAIGLESVPTYLYTLSAEVILGAAYLFWTYWIAMRNMMYANR